MCVVRFTAWAVLLLGVAGCSSVSVIPNPEADALREQTRLLNEKNRSLVAQQESLRIHARSLEDQLKRTEDELALIAEKSSLDKQQLAKLETEQQQVYRQVRSLHDNRPAPTSANAERIAALAQKHPHLRFDPVTGIAKLDTDIVFDTGSNTVKPAAERALQDLVTALNAPGAKDFRVLVVGHTDDLSVAGGPIRDKHPDNFHLSADRALAVTERLRRLGLADQRLGVAGFGAHQPLAPNLSAGDRQRNRRVEVFVMAAEVPVVGWTETTPSLY